jgi:hypothetical protein
MQHDIPDNKVCPNCNVDKPASEYHRNGARKDGLTYVCAECIPIYEAKDKRPKRKLESIQKSCKKCGRLLAARQFQYAQNTEDHLRDSCRTCSAFKPKRVPSIEEINLYESTMGEIFGRAKALYDLEQNRSELEQYIYKEMLKANLISDWDPPVWVHKSSLPD